MQLATDCATTVLEVYLLSLSVGAESQTIWPGFLIEGFLWALPVGNIGKKSQQKEERNFCLTPKYELLEFVWWQQGQNNYSFLQLEQRLHIAVYL